MSLYFMVISLITQTCWNWLYQNVDLWTDP
nr:MAG TPA: hypothetical protein [Caudoviricetes sp.]